MSIAAPLTEAIIGTGSATPAQLKAIFAAGRRAGLDHDDIRAMTPGGSVKALTRLEASQLLDRLNANTAYEQPRIAPRGRRRPKGVYRIATSAQLAKIESLRIELRWTTEGLRGWLSERHHRDGRRMTTIDSSADAITVIELLKAVVSRTSATKPGEGQGLPYVASAGPVQT